MISHYEILQGEFKVGTAKTKNGARSARDRRDTNYGANIHRVFEVMRDGRRRFVI